MRDDLEMLTVSFALAVTRKAGPCDLIAWRGPRTLHSALGRMVPEFVLPEQMSRIRTPGTIACAAALKVLQRKCGFKLVRSRRRGIDRAGSLLFSHRRWLSPSRYDDLRDLETSFLVLRERFPCFARCPLSQFLFVVGDISSAWNTSMRNVKFWHSVANADTEGDCTDHSSGGTFVEPRLSSRMDVAYLLNPPPRTLAALERA
mmetsp:Transcript_25624/g.67696  ORF Transcript_25624/g.67696 Transcript_25624/m.67696 type:complete len:203 (+) Transcript_25624:3-611(+)